VLDRADVEHWRIHDLRHGFASAAVAPGAHGGLDKAGASSLVVLYDDTYPLHDFGPLSTPINSGAGWRARSPSTSKSWFLDAIAKVYEERPKRLLPLKPRCDRLSLVAH